MQREIDIARTRLLDQGRTCCLMFTLASSSPGGPPCGETYDRLRLLGRGRLLQVLVERDAAHSPVEQPRVTKCVAMNPELLMARVIHDDEHEGVPLDPIPLLG